jgi:hypothetical protein
MSRKNYKTDSYKPPFPTLESLEDKNKREARKAVWTFIVIVVLFIICS